jgi:hypothetical protein
MDSEPTVLDYLKALLTPWRGKPPVIPIYDEEIEKAEEVKPPPQVRQIEIDKESLKTQAPREAGIKVETIPWRTSIAIGLALIAQRSLEPVAGIERSWNLGVFFYLLSAILAVWGILRGEWWLPSPREGEYRQDSFSIQRTAILACLPLAALSFFLFRGAFFTPGNVTIWLAAIILFVVAFWKTEPGVEPWFRRMITFLANRDWQISISRSTLLVLAIVGLAVFMRTYRLADVPPEMTSDHVEKLLDVGELLEGETRIFFPRNTGREGLQMYLTAAVALVFGTGLSFTSLKIGTILGGLLTLPYIYLMGREVGTKQTGLLALAFAGIAYWPNVIARAALRFTLYPLFVAPTLYYLIRGIRRSNRNDFILAGIFLGIGLHGYTPVRILPIVVVVAVGLYLLHRHSQGLRLQTAWSLALLTLTAFLVFLPLISYWTVDPATFNYRALTRLGPIEQPLPGTAWQIFIQNLWNALLMFSWDSGEVWLISVINRPALDVVSGGLFHLGIVLLVVRYLRHRHWLDLFLLISLPLLMMPSIMSLAFPNENPVLNRTGGALVVTFVIVGLALDSILTTLKNRLRGPAGAWLAGGLAVFLISCSFLHNYDLVFNQYQRSYAASAWNTSELGGVIKNFAGSIGSAETAWVVPYPHWVDTRLVGVHAGYPGMEYALWPREFESTVAEPRAKLFLLRIGDDESRQLLQQIYPQGTLQEYSSRYPFKNFLMFFVPAQGG